MTDAGGAPTTPHIKHPGEEDTHGRGLALVSKLAERLHISGDDKHGHTVLDKLPAPKPDTALVPGYWCECLVNGGKSWVPSTPPAPNRR